MHLPALQKYIADKILECCIDFNKEDTGISFLIPSYRRPKNMYEFCLWADKNAAKHGKIEVVFGSHADDQASIKAIPKIQKCVRIKVRLVLLNKPPDGKPHLSLYWNELFKHAKYQIVGYFGDDVRIKTPRWDNIVYFEFKKNPFILLYGDDVHCQHGDAATLFFTNKACHEQCGFYMFPQFRRCWMDQFWDMVYHQAGLRILRRDLVLEHLHPGTFRDRVDQTYNELESMFHKEPSFSVCHADIARCVQILKKMYSEWIRLMPRG